MAGICAFWVFMRTRLNIEPYSPLRPTARSVLFSLGLKSLSGANDIAAVNHVT